MQLGMIAIHRMGVSSTRRSDSTYAISSNRRRQEGERGDEQQDRGRLGRSCVGGLHWPQRRPLRRGRRRRRDLSAQRQRRGSGLSRSYAVGVQSRLRISLVGTAWDGARRGAGRLLPKVHGRFGPPRRCSQSGPAIPVAAAMKDEIASSFCRPAKLSNGGARHGAAAHHRGNARRHPDGRRQLRRTRQGLKRSSFSREAPRCSSA